MSNTNKQQQQQQQQLEYKFRVNSTKNLLPVLTKLVQVLELHADEYTYNNITNVITVIKDKSWQNFVLGKIKDLGFEYLIQKRDLSKDPIRESKIVEMDIPYVNIESLSRANAALSDAYSNDGKCDIKLLKTVIDYEKMLVKVVAKVTNKDFNIINYEVALLLLNVTYTVYPLVNDFDSVMNKLLDVVSEDPTLVDALKSVKYFLS